MKKFLRSPRLRFLAPALLAVMPLAQALTYQEALQAAPARPAAVTTRLELLNAGSEQLRTEADPLALRLDRVQARQKVELKEAELTKAHYDALLEISEAYAAALQTRTQLMIAEKGVALAEAGVRIAEIRLANGSATALDVQEARVSAESAAQGALTARSGLALALSNLAGMTGLELRADELEEIPAGFLPELPPLEGALEAVKSSPQLLQAQQGLELATLAVGMLDPSYASQAQIEAARTQLDTTAELVAEAQRGMELQARNLHLQAETAAANIRIESDNTGNAAERLAFQQERLDSGLIAQIQFDQEELAYLQTKLALLQAQHDYLHSVLELAAGTLVPLEGPAVLAPDVPRLGAAATEAGEDD